MKLVYFCNMKFSASENIKPHLALAAVAILYGLNYIIAKDVMVKEYVTPFGFIMLRVIAAFSIFTAIHAIFVKEKLEKKDMRYVVLCSIFGVVINMLAFFEGLKHTSPIHASLIMVLTPALVLVISSFVIKEGITRSKVSGIILGFVGAGLLIYNSASESNKVASVYGDLLILLNATSYGLYLVLVRRLYLKYKPITVLKWIFFFGMLIIIPFGGYDALTADYSSFPLDIWLSVFYVIVLTTAITYLLNAYALSRVMPSTVGFYIYFQPLIASGVSIMMGHDILDFIKLCSALLIFTGVYFVNRQDKS